MKTGIVGSGIAGLTAAWLCSSSGHEVTLFEKHRLGLDGHSLALQHPNSGCRVDVPLRLLNQNQWPALWQLYDLLGIERVEIETSQSFSGVDQSTCVKVDLAHLFRHLPNPFFNAKNVGLFREIRRLKKGGSQDVVNGLSEGLSFSRYLSTNGYSEEFQFGFLYPALSSTVCTCSYDALNRYPAAILLDVLMKLTGTSRGKSHRLFKARFGMADVVQKLLQHEPVIIENATVTSVQDYPDRVALEYSDKSGRLTRIGCFDHVIIATQANQALSLLASPSSLEADMLASFDYEPVEIVIHSDPRLMPRRKTDWSAFNTISSDSTDGTGGSMCSIWINRLDREFEATGNIFQTINPIIEPDGAMTLHSSRLQRPVVNQNSFRGWSLLDQIHSENSRRIWFAGSYASYGVPLLETAVVSVLKVASALGIETPFSKTSVSNVPIKLANDYSN